MKFKISKRMAVIGNLNVRTERHGEERVPASDISIKFAGTKRDLDMLCPLAEGKFSELLYNEEGHLISPYLSPLKVHRKPETLTIHIYDQETNHKRPLIFINAKAKDIQVVLNPKHQLEISMKIQVNVDPDTQGARLYQIMSSTHEFSIEAAQPDLFEDDDTETIKVIGEDSVIDDDEDEGDDGQESLLDEDDAEDK